MPTGYQIDNPTGLYFLTLQVIDWVDVFTRKIYRDILLSSFKYCCQNKGLRLWAYVVMSNHVHLIVSTDHGKLPDILRDMKRFTATSILDTIENQVESRKDWMLKRFEFTARRHKRNSTRQFWTHENHAVELFSGKFIRQKCTYIHDNPVRAGWVNNASDWLYSSASNYEGRGGLIEVDLLYEMYHG
ncbi:MAG: transposase [Saprospiraceae bacterium]